MRGWVFVAPFLLGCGALLTVAKGPLVDKCTEAELKGCDQLADGVIKYLSGEKDEGKRDIVRGAAKNDPADVKTFATAIRAASDIPGLGDYKPQLEEIATLLEDKAAAPEHKKPTHEHKEAAAETASADTKSTNVRAGTVSARATSPCSTPLGSVGCARGPSGAGTITMLLATGGCPSDMVAFTGEGDAPTWWVVMPANASVSLQRVTLPIGGDESIRFGFRSDANDPRCSITWVMER